MGSHIGEREYDDYAQIEDLSNPHIPGVYFFNPGDGEVMPIHVVSLDMNLGEPNVMKNFRYLEFHGSGIASCRVFVDDIARAEGTCILSENPSKSRKIALQRGVHGYTIRFELYGNFHFNFAECTFDVLEGSK